MMHESRLRAMIAPDGLGHWDLNDEDRAAIAWALRRIDGLKDERKPEPLSLLQACQAVLLFYRAGHWGPEEQEQWRTFTGFDEATTVALCDTVRAAIAAAVIERRTP